MGTFDLGTATLWAAAKMATLPTFPRKLGHLGRGLFRFGAHALRGRLRAAAPRP